MKNRILLAIIGLASVLSVGAQPAENYPLLSGGTTSFSANTTNSFTVGTNTFYIGLPGTPTNLFQTVAEFDNVGFTWQYKGVASTTNGAAACKVYRSYDGGTTFEDYPGFTYSRTPAGAGTYTTNGVIAVTGVTHLAFVVENGAAGPLTNALLEIYLKSPKYGAKAATR